MPPSIVFYLPIYTLVCGVKREKPDRAGPFRQKKMLRTGTEIKIPAFDVLCYYEIKPEGVGKGFRKQALFGKQRPGFEVGGLLSEISESLSC